VIDQGAGVPVELLASIFDRHFDPSGHRPESEPCTLPVWRLSGATSPCSADRFADNLYGGGFRVTVDLSANAGLDLTFNDSDTPDMR
jgi:hypothetical protein